MKFLGPIILIAATVFAVGCSSGSSNPTTPADNNLPRVGLTEPYEENLSSFVDINLANIPFFSGFSLIVEFDPDCVNIEGFEPLSFLGSNTNIESEMINDITPPMRSRMMKTDNELVKIGVAPGSFGGDVLQPRGIGRIKFKVECSNSSSAPFTIFDDSGSFQIFGDDEIEIEIEIEIEDEFHHINDDHGGDRGDDDSDDDDDSNDDNGGDRDDDDSDDDDDDDDNDDSDDDDDDDDS